MLNLYATWCKRIRNELKSGDMNTIHEETGLAYHKVQRMLETGRSANPLELEKVFEVAIRLVESHSLSSQQVVAQFNAELIEEKQSIASQATEKVKKLKGD